MAKSVHRITRIALLLCALYVCVSLSVVRANDNTEPQSTKPSLFYYPVNDVSKTLAKAVPEQVKRLCRIFWVPGLCDGWNSEGELGGNEDRRGDLSPTSPAYGIDYDDLYDYIIVGAGAAGCPLARTLDDSGNKVLLLERGGPREDNPVTLKSDAVPNVILDRVVSEPIYTTEGVPTHVGYAVGGGTAVNGGLYIEDDDEYLEILSRNFDVNLNKDAVQEGYDYIRRSRMVHKSPADALWPNTREMSDPTAGFEPVTGYSYPFLYGFIRTYTILNPEDNTRYAADVLLEGSDVELRPYSQVERILFDLEGGPRPRAACVEYIVNDKERLAANAGGIGNVWQSIFDATVEPPPTATVCIRPTGRVILSSGAIYSPVLLMKSGIGPEQHLRDRNLDVVLPNEAVGQNLHDHPQIGLTLFSNQENARTSQATYSTQRTGDCEATGGSTDPFQGNCFFTLSESISGGEWLPFALTLLLEKQARMASTNNEPEFFGEAAAESVRKCVVAIARSSATEENSGFLQPLINCGAVLNTLLDCWQQAVVTSTFLGDPISRGELTLDENLKPVVTGGYFREERDRQSIIQAVRKLIEIVGSDAVQAITEFGGSTCPLRVYEFMPETTTSSVDQMVSGKMEGYGFEEASGQSVDVNSLFGGEHPPATFPPLPHKLDDRSLFHFIYRYFVSIWHWVGSASFHKVVDEKFQVLGAENLSVVDASVLPQVPRINCMSTILMIGRYAGRKILGDF